MEPKLTKIPVEDLTKLRDLFKASWPKHVVSYATIGTFMRKCERNPDILKEIEILCLNGEWERDATFIIHVIKTNYLLLGTLDNSCINLRAALNLLDFNLPLKFACVPESYRSMICDIGRHRQLSNDDLTKCFHLPKEKVGGFEYVVPGGYEIRSLTSADIEIINTLWAHSFPGSESYLENLIVNNIGMGLYQIAKHEIVGWIMWTDMGALGILQVRDEYKGRGFGSLLVKAFSKLAVATYDVDITAHILLTNQASIKLFQQLGFVELHLNSWVGFESPN